jgi:TolA-binding protein
MLVLFFVASSAFAAENTEDAGFMVARKAFNDGFYDLAKDKVEAFLDLYPHTPYLYDAHLLLGRCFYNLNNPAKAVNEFNIILETPGGSTLEDEALYWMGEISFNEGDYNKALEYYQDIIKRFPSSRYVSYASYSKGWAYFELGFLEEAIDSFRDVSQKYPFDKIAMDSQFRIGECEYLMGRFPKASEELTAFMEKFPVSEKTLDSYYMSGETLFSLGRYKESVESLKRALAIAPKARWAGLARYRIARAYFLSGDYVNSSENFKRCAEIPDCDALLLEASLLGLADSYAKLGRDDEAIGACDEISAKYPSTDSAGKAAYIRSRIYFARGAWQDAEYAIKEALAKHGASSSVWDMRYELGCIYMIMARPDDAMGQFVLVKNGSGDPELVSGAIARMGDICLTRREYKAASENFDAILTKYPGSRSSDYAQYQLGNIFLYTGKFGQASLAYQSLSKNFPDSPLRDASRPRLASSSFLNNDFARSAAEFGRMAKEEAKQDPVLSGKFYLANSLYNLSKYDEALALFKDVAAYSSDERTRAMADYQIGWCYHNMRKESAAIDHFNRFLKERPQDSLGPDVKFWFAEYYRSKLERDKARGYYRMIAGEYPSSDIASEALIQTGNTFQEEGRLDEAIKEFALAARDFPDTAAARNAYRKMARIEKDRKDFDRAAEYYRKALTKENNEANAQVQYEIAELYELKGDVKTATEEYLRSHDLYFKGAFWSTRALLKAAQLFEKAGNIKEAKNVYGQLAGMDVVESKLAKEKLKSFN